MAISALDASLPTLEDLITLVHAVPLPKRSACGSLVISDAIFTEDEVESIRALALVREIPARCKSLINADGRIHKVLILGLGTFDCKTALCTRHILANSSIDRRAQPQVAVERFAVLDFRRSLVNSHLAIGCAKAL
jgi:hypothetical protein